MNRALLLKPSAARREPGLGQMLLLSAVAHALVVAGLVVVSEALSRRPALVSYTVELVAPDVVGGTNLAERKKKAAAKRAPGRRPKAKERAGSKPQPVRLAKVRVRAAPTSVPGRRKVARAAPTPLPKKRALAPPPTRARPRQVAAVRKRPPATEKPLDPAARAREARIAAAIRRVERLTLPRAARSGAGGGPLSIGPGEGVGGRLRSAEYVRYVSRMTAKIKDNWVWAGSNRTLRAVVAFTVLSTGRIANIRVALPSGDPSYDRSAQRAVRAASPLPRPPERYGDDFAWVEYTFRPEEAEEAKE